MPKNRKYFPHNSVLFVTTRTEVGLPLVATFVMNLIIWGVLAKARSRFAVRVCHFVFMYNHFHMILVVDNPEDVSNFMAYVKCEITHAVNRLLGRRQRTVWQSGYDSPILGTVEDVQKYIRYIYLNPAKADLVRSIREYPGVSSWDMYSGGIHKKKCKKIARSLIKPLAFPAMGINEQKRFAAKYNSLSAEEHSFVLEPNAWSECFLNVTPDKLQRWNLELKREILDSELAIDSKRKENGRSVIGATALRRQSMLKEYIPRKYQRRMICICSDQRLRRQIVAHFRALCDTARDVYRRWQLGELQLRIPPGLFAPRLPCIASALPILS